MGLYYRVTKQSAKKRRQESCFLYRNLSLLLILFITFKVINSPERASSNEQPRYVTVWYCLMCISPYLMSRRLTLLSLCFVPNNMHFVLSSPSECSVCYLQTNHKHLKSFYLAFSLFPSHLCADKLNRSCLHKETSHSLQLV